MVLDLLSWTFVPPTTTETSESDAPILIDPTNPSRSLSRRDLLTKVKQLIAGLKAEGINSGDCVLVNAFNDIYYTVFYLGIIGAGGIFTGVNPSYKESELLHHMNLTKPKFIIAQPEMLDETVRAAEEMGITSDKIFIFMNPLNGFRSSLYRSFDTLFTHGESTWRTDICGERVIAQYASTSGTSGQPKAARISHAYHVSQAFRFTMQTSNPQPHDVRLTGLPPFHTFATPLIPASIRQGVPVVVMRRTQTDLFLDYVETYKITETFLSPPTIVALPNHPRCTADTLASLRRIWVGGAVLKYSSALPLYEKLNQDAKILPVWGMTEAGWITAGLPAYPRLTDNSVGIPLLGYRVAAIEDDTNSANYGNKLDLNQVGELCVRVTYPFLGYVNNDEATDSVIKGEWIHTGDMGSVQSNHFISIIDRKKDIIKVRGWQVSPAEIEAALLEHTDIIDAAVIGVDLPDGSGDSCPLAFIVTRPECATGLDINQITEFLCTRLARYKLPAHYVFLDKIPKNVTGKFLRNDLKEMSKDGSLGLDMNKLTIG